MTGHSRQCEVWPLRGREKLQTRQERQDRWQHTWMKGCKERCREMRDAGAVRLADRLSIILYEAPHPPLWLHTHNMCVCVCVCVCVSERLLKANASKSCPPFSVISFPPTERERIWETAIELTAPSPPLSLALSREQADESNSIFIGYSVQKSS